jgi:hypothetical protein
MGELKNILATNYDNGFMNVNITFFIDVGKAHIAGRSNVYDFRFDDADNLLLIEIKENANKYGEAQMKEVNGFIIEAGCETVLELKDAIVEYAIEVELLGG